MVPPLRYDELRTAFQELKWLVFYGVLSSVKTFMRKLHSTPMRANETVKGVTLTELISKRKVNNFIYTSLLKKKTPPPIRSQEKWRRDLRGHNDVMSSKCCFCEQETETIIHLFLHCYITQGFWNDVKQFLFQKGLGSDFVFTDLHLMGLSNVLTYTAIDLVLLLARYHIHSCKLGGVWPCFSVFNSKLNTIIQVKKQVALRSYRLKINGGSFFVKLVLLAPGKP